MSLSNPVFAANSVLVVRLLITGTDPNTAKGGIGVVLPGYIRAAELAGYAVKIIPTFSPGSVTGKFWPWLRGLFPVMRFVFLSKRDGTRPVVYAHAGDGISFFREAVVLGLARLFGAATLLQIHSPRLNEYLNQPFQRFLIQILLRTADTVCVLTPWWRERLLGAGVTGRIAIIPNPLPQNLVEAAQKPVGEDADRDDRRVLNVLAMARLVSGKGFDVAIRAFALLPATFGLTIAGDGPLRHELERLAQELGLQDRVRFVGWAAGNEKERLLREADIFCLPSTYDAFPMSMVEAMAYGVPVVAVKWGGIPDMVADGKTGILVDRPDPGAIAEAMKRLSDKTVRLSMGREGKRWILDLSSPQRVALQLSQVISETLGA